MADVAISAQPQADEGTSIANRRLAQEKLDRKRKQREVCSDAEREGNSRAEYQRWILSQAAGAVGDVAPEVLRKREPPQIGGFLFYAGYAAQRNGVPVSRGHFAMEFELGFEIAAPIAAADEF
jgi:hypothetical protein